MAISPLKYRCSRSDARNGWPLPDSEMADISLTTTPATPKPRRDNWPAYRRPGGRHREALVQLGNATSVDDAGAQLDTLGVTTPPVRDVDATLTGVTARAHSPADPAADRIAPAVAGHPFAGKRAARWQSPATW